MWMVLIATFDLITELSGLEVILGAMAPLIIISGLVLIYCLLPGQNSLSAFPIICKPNLKLTFFAPDYQPK